MPDFLVVVFDNSEWKSKSLEKLGISEKRSVINPTMVLDKNNKKLRLLNMNIFSYITIYFYHIIKILVLFKSERLFFIHCF